MEHPHLATFHQLRQVPRALTLWLITDFSWYMLAMEPKTHGDVQAVHRLLSVMTLRCCDVDGDWEEDGDIHSDDRSGPA